jgi:hypothetical protein
MLAGAIGLGVGSLLIWFSTHWQHDSDFVEPPQHSGPFGFAIATWIAGACLVVAGAVFAWRYMKSR